MPETVRPVERPAGVSSQQEGIELARAARRYCLRSAGVTRAPGPRRCRKLPLHQQGDPLVLWILLLDTRTRSKAAGELVPEASGGRRGTRPRRAAPAPPGVGSILCTRPRCRPSAWARRRRRRPAPAAHRPFEDLLAVDRLAERAPDFDAALRMGCRRLNTSGM